MGEDTGPLTDEDRVLLAEATAEPDRQPRAEWTRQALADVTAAKGIDFATALYYQHLRRSARHAPFIERMEELMARRCHAAITPLGPNDGGILLADACVLPGLLYPAWGADHNLRPDWDIRRLASALLQYLAEGPDAR